VQRQLCIWFEGWLKTSSLAIDPFHAPLSHQATRECLLLLRNLMQLWLTLLSEESGGVNLAALAAAAAGLPAPAQQPPPSAHRGGGGGSAAAAAELDLQRLEGTLFVLLCSFDDALRRDAFGSLYALRTLHERLARRRADAAALSAAAGTVPGGAATVAIGASGEGLGGLAGALGGLAARAGAPRHAPSASHDSIEFVRALGSFEAQQAPPGCATYLMDVLEEVRGDWRGSSSSSSGSSSRVGATKARAQTASRLSIHPPGLHRPRIRTGTTTPCVGRRRRRAPQLLGLWGLERRLAGVEAGAPGAHARGGCSHWEVPTMKVPTLQTPLQRMLHFGTCLVFEIATESNPNRQTLMAAKDDVGCLRWARCAIELARAAAAMCPESVAVACGLALTKLQQHAT
jgi:hypothetical protein